MRSLKFTTAVLVAAALLVGGMAFHAQEAESYTEPEIEQMVAPIALYPDALLSQALMAATFPDQVAEADDWLQSNPGISGAELDDALSTSAWDPSVISLCKFPTLLHRMGSNMDWTADLGYAFLGQREQVFGAVQKLRRASYRAGYLRSTPQQRVIADPQYIQIQPYNPNVVYVPVYNPAVVYGSAWGYPTYYYRSAWAPSPGVTFVNGFGWGVGFAVGNALFGGLDWRRHDVYVNKTVIVHNRIYRNTDFYHNRDRYKGRHNWSRPAHRHNRDFRGAPYGGRRHGSIRPTSHRRPGNYGRRSGRANPHGRSGRVDRPGRRTGPGARPGSGHRPGKAPGRVNGRNNRRTEPGARPGSGHRPGKAPGRVNGRNNRRNNHSARPGSGHRPGKAPGRVNGRNNRRNNHSARPGSRNGRGKAPGRVNGRNNRQKNHSARPGSRNGRGKAPGRVNGRNNRQQGAVRRQNGNRSGQGARVRPKASRGQNPAGKKNKPGKANKNKNKGKRHQQR